MGLSSALSPIAWTYDFVAAIVSLDRWNTWIHLALNISIWTTHPRGRFWSGHLLITSIKCQKNIVGIDESKQKIIGKKNDFYGCG